MRVTWHLAALAVEYGATLCSADADFSRFPGLSWHTHSPSSTRQRRAVNPAAALGVLTVRARRRADPEVTVGTVPRMALVGLTALVAVTACTGSPSGSESRSAPSGAASGAAGDTEGLDTERLDTERLRRQVETAMAPTSIGFGGRLFCGIRVLGLSDDGRHAYLWAACQEFYRSAATVGTGSGVSLPVRVERATGEVTAPGDGAAYGPDVQRLFPASLVPQILDNTLTVDQDEVALKARAERELTTP